MIGSLRAYAKHRKGAGLAGGTLAAVQKALATKRISKGSDGQIEFDRADRDWEANLNHRKARPPKTAAGAAAVPKQSGSDPIGPPEGTGVPLETFLEAQRQHEWLRVQKEELAVRKRRGELVEKSEVEKQWGILLTTFRNRMLLLPDKIAPRVAVLDQVLECRALIEREVREALLALSEYQSDAA